MNRKQTDPVTAALAWALLKFSLLTEPNISAKRARKIIASFINH